MQHTYAKHIWHNSGFDFVNNINMSVFAIIVLALGMSMDAFAAALARGASLPKDITFGRIICTGAIFGGIEMIAPLIGFAVGSTAFQFIHSWDHWIAFILLSGLGLRMVYEGLHNNGQDTKNIKVANQPQNTWLLIITAIGTSIDSMIIGVSLAFLAVNILTSALLIGLATTVMATLGLWLGRFLGNKIGQWAEIGGGLVLISIGVMVLIEHLALF